MRNVLGMGLLATAAGALVLAGINEFLTDLPPWKVAVMLVGGALLVLGTIALCLQVFSRALTRPGRSTPPPQPYSHSVLDDDTLPDTLPNYQPPRQQLPAPRYITVPRFITNGQSQPWGVPPPAPVELQTVDAAGQTLSVPLKYMMRFAGLPTPARSEWSGKTTMYTDCRNFFMTHGLLDPAGHWHPGYPLPQRKEWLEQFEGHARDR